MSEVEETLAREAEERPRAAAAALAGGILTILGSLLLLLALRDYPSEDDGFISVTESIGSRLNGQTPDERSLLAAQLTERQDTALAGWASALFTSLAVVLAMYALLFLYRATKARAPETTRVPWFAAMIALVAYPIGHMLSEGAVLLGDEVDPNAPGAADQAKDVFGSGVVLLGETLEFFGTFALGLAFVLVALNAMRVGLLTRFMGILGIIVGVLAVVQLDLPQLIRTFWLVALGLMIAGRLRQRPPAWETGRQQPWPSQQQLREQRMASPEPEPVAEEPATEPATTAAPVKRKRKKRR